MNRADANRLVCGKCPATHVQTIPVLSPRCFACRMMLQASQAEIASNKAAARAVYAGGASVVHQSTPFPSVTAFRGPKTPPRTRPSSAAHHRQIEDATTFQGSSSDGTQYRADSPVFSPRSQSPRCRSPSPRCRSPSPGSTCASLRLMSLPPGWCSSSASRGSPVTSELVRPTSPRRSPPQRGVGFAFPRSPLWGQKIDPWAQKSDAEVVIQAFEPSPQGSVWEASWNLDVSSSPRRSPGRRFGGASSKRCDTYKSVYTTDTPYARIRSDVEIREPELQYHPRNQKRLDKPASRPRSANQVWGHRRQHRVQMLAPRAENAKYLIY